MRGEPVSEWYQRVQAEQAAFTAAITQCINDGKPRSLKDIEPEDSSRIIEAIHYAGNKLNIKLKVVYDSRSKKVIFAPIGI